MPGIFSLLFHARTSASSSPSAESPGMTSQERGFLQKLAKRKPATRSVGNRIEGAVHKAAKVIRKQVAVQKAAQLIGKRGRSPDPRSFAALERDYTAWSARSPTLPFDKREADRLLKMASTYIARASASGRPDLLKEAKIRQASRYVLELDKGVLQDRRGQQDLIDAQYPGRFADGHAQREAAREGHAGALRRMRQEFDRADGRADGRAVVPVGDTDVNGFDGAAVYRFRPAPTRTAIGETGRGPANAALASALNDRLKLYLKVDFGLPKATVAALDGSPGVLVDGDAFLLDGPAGADLVNGDALQRSVLAQWLIGQPRAGWHQMRYDKQGLLRPSELPTEMLSPRDIAQDALRGVSPLFKHHPEFVDRPIDELHRPIDSALVDNLLRLDIRKLQRDLNIDRDRIDVAMALRAKAAGHPLTHFASLHKEAVGRMLEPLRALQTALKTGRDLPLAMVLADAAEVLQTSPYPSTRESRSVTGHPAC